MQTDTANESGRGPEPWPAVARGVLRDFRRTWPQLAVTDALAKIAAFLVLTPALAGLARLFVGSGAEAVLTDEEILFFFLRPTGLALLVTAVAVWAGISFAELAALMTIGFGARQDRHVSYLQALRRAAGRAPTLVRLAGRLAAVALLVAAPFLALAGGVYALLLTAHDINYYLSAKPRAFWIAGALIGALLSGMAAALAALAARWCLALPMVLFEARGPREALSASARATAGHRRALVLVFLGWGLVTVGASAAVTALVGLVDRLLVSGDTTSLAAAAVVIGASLLVLTLANAAVSLFSTSALALLLVRVFARFAGSGTLEGGGVGAPGSLGARARWSVPRQGLLWGGLAAVLAVAVAVGVMLEGVRADHTVAVAAHRGGAAAAPENTLAAIERAIAAGTDWVEIDVQETADGVVTVLHDEDFLRVGGVAGKIWQLSRAEVERIDIGSRFAPEFAAERPPTLAQVLETCAGRTNVIIELKDYGHGQRLEQRVVELVEAAGMTEHVEIISLSADDLRATRALRPSWTYGWLVAVAMGDLARADFDFVAVRAPLATRGLIRAAHRRGKRVYAWTVDDAVQMAALVGRGVDVLITDRPGRARAVLEEYAALSTVERLLLVAGLRFGLLDEDESLDPEDA